MKRTIFHGLLAIAALFAAGCGSMPPGPAAGQGAPAQAAAPESAASAAPTREEASAIAAIDDDRAIYFTLGGTAVDEAGKAKLRQHAARLKGNPDRIVTLTGYTDDLGSSNYNLAIAEQRTLAVAQVLQSFGIPAKQIRRYAVGSEKVPKVCRSATCRAKMRRVDLEYSP